MNIFRAMSRILVVAAVIFTPYSFSERSAFVNRCDSNKFTTAFTVLANQQVKGNEPLKKALFVSVGGGLDAASHPTATGASIMMHAGAKGSVSYVSNKTANYFGIDRNVVKKYVEKDGYGEYAIDIIADSGLAEVAVMMGAAPVVGSAVALGGVAVAAIAKALGIGE